MFYHHGRLDFETVNNTVYTLELILGSVKMDLTENELALNKH